ncbi:Kef-type K+ transport system membrane component KefB [Nonomuraea polychroma]|uniref:Kef-type K+ transport system membrane component KefB n=1 Tax=Nonomuraea polychroma TaxID=46176 RepID=A0A438MEE6_9ACTN|nr:cation:proton antiporter [Nonomuraea polychroma]RVX44163.1 Kef-type K+ transport system membrane component KefB [Nonomuraea polychroma]
MHSLTALLCGIAAIITLSCLLGMLARRFDQPAVIGEVFAGILLGPTLFGGVVSQTLFPTDIRPFLAGLASVGVVVFMFLVGLEVDHGGLRGKAGVAATVSIGSILVPFGLGAALAVQLADRHPGPDRLAFALFMGAAMSVTAFPVLARILKDRNMHRTALGALALTCAAADDVLAWTMLAVIAALVNTGDDPWRLLLVAPYLVVMFAAVRPLLGRLAAKGGLTPVRLSVVLVGLLLSASLTEWIGLHAVFGAFLFGAVVPRQGTERIRQEILEGVGQFTAVILLPIFFVVGGLSVDLSRIGVPGLVELGLILMVAIGGKFMGAFLGARVHGLPSRQSAALATLMNTRGLTELIILSVGLQLHLLDQDLYSLMVLMALVTTAMSGPLLRVLHPARRPEAPVLEPVRL